MNSSAFYAYVTPDEVQRKIEAGDDAVFVDVRTRPEYAQRHIADVILMPLDEFADRSKFLARDREIICICEHGVRSEVAARYLAAQGFSRAATMTGGMAVYQGPTESERL